MVQTGLIRSFSQSEAASVFQRYGLRRRVIAHGETTYQEQVPPSARLRNALEEMGGLYASFGRFLAWRADLLRTDVLTKLRDIRIRSEAVPFVDVNELLREQFPSAQIVLEPEPLWSTPSRCAYPGRLRDRRVVVQVALPPPAARDFVAFERNIALIDEPFFQPALDRAVLRQFQSWLSLSVSLDRERSYLESLSGLRERGLVEYPQPVPELSSSLILTLEWVDGEPVSAALARASADAVRRVAECIVEQICVLGAIDADFDVNRYVLTPSGKLAARAVDHFVAIPPALVNASLKYVSSVLSADAPAATHLLVKLAYGRTALHLEEQLLDELSNLEPELKVNVQFPQSVAVFESNWRALRRLDIERPLFLDAMHRNLVAVGYWNSEIAPVGGRLPDLISDAQWPVLSALLRSRIADLFTRDAASDWAIGTGLLFVESIRQSSRLADQFRQNEVSLGFDLQHSREQAKKAHQTIRYRVFVGMLLIVFLVSLRFAVVAPPPWSGVCSAVAVISAAALFWFVSRIE